MAIVLRFFGTPFGKHLGQWLDMVASDHLLFNHYAKCFGSDIHVSRILVISFLKLSQLSFAMSFGRLFGTPGAHIQSLSVTEFCSNI